MLYPNFNGCIKIKKSVIARLIPVKNKKTLTAAIFRCVFSWQITHERHSGRLPQPFLFYFFIEKSFAMTSAYI
jgi:hypothetical protein